MSKSIVDSKTKIGSVVGGGSLILGALWGLYTGNLTADQGVPLIGMGVSAVLVGLGLRDALPD